MRITRYQLLRITLAAFGLMFVVMPVFLVVFPNSWSWHEGTAETMIFCVYLVLGLFLLRAARKPEEHLSLIWFTMWSSAAHGGLMMVQSLTIPDMENHMHGDSLGLVVTAIVLAILTPGTATSKR